MCILCTRLPVVYVQCNTDDYPDKERVVTCTHDGQWTDIVLVSKMLSLDDHRYESDTKTKKYFLLILIFLAVYSVSLTT